MANLSTTLLSFLGRIHPPLTPGVYNKVMNFRAIDPRDPRAGLGGAGAMDRKIWALFYDVASSTMRSAALEAEYRNLWSATHADQPPEAEGAPAQDFEREVAKLTALSLTDLGARLEAETIETAPTVSIMHDQLATGRKIRVLTVVDADSVDPDQPFRPIVITCHGDRNHAVHPARGVHGGRLRVAHDRYH